MFESIEPYYGWRHIYNNDLDAASPFHEVEHNLFAYDRRIYTFNAHPQWETIESESLLVKILYANYERGCAIIELLGEWNDLFQNDFKLLCENCLTFLSDAGVDKFILICENVFNAYLDADDYYEAFGDEIEEGWMCLFRARPNVLEEFDRYNISQYFYWNPQFDGLRWRKLKPWALFQLVEESMRRALKP